MKQPEVLRLVTVPLRGVAGDGPKLQGREVLTRVFSLALWVVVGIRFNFIYGGSEYHCGRAQWFVVQDGAHADVI